MTRLNQFYGEISVRIVNIGPIEPRSATRNNTRPQIEPPIHLIMYVEEDEDARRERDLNEAHETIDGIRVFDLESDDERYMEDVPIVEETEFHPNELDFLTDQFARLNTRLDCINAWIISCNE